MNSLKTSFDHPAVKKIHIVGIKGVAMTGLAVIFKKMGKQVVGSDVSEGFITDPILKKHQIKVVKGFKKANIDRQINLVIYSAAHKGKNNIEVKTARSQGIKVANQAQVIGELIRGFKNKVAVCGCHGKTTTASLLAYSLIKLGVRPSYLVGTSHFAGYPGGDFRGRDFFIVEADEYGVNPPFDNQPKFSYLDPDYIIATNIDYDHPDVYSSIKETKAAFLAFFKKLLIKPREKRLLFSADNPLLVSVTKNLPSYLIEGYGFSKESDLMVSAIDLDRGKTRFKLRYKEKPLGWFNISIYGKKNVVNASAVVLFLLHQGFNLAEIKRAISGFTGAKRRFELLFSDGETYLFDDYAHHPEEIKATIEAARFRFPKKRVIVVFQPHTYSRTEALKEKFTQALGLADYSFILPIFPSARESADDFQISSKVLEQLAKKEGMVNIKTVADPRSLEAGLKERINRGDIIFLIGAGNVYKFKDRIRRVITQIGSRQRSNGG